MSGGTLRSVLEREDKLSDHRLRLLLAELTNAVSHLHRLGIVHRDLKPDNIMFDGNGRIRLIDFDFASFAADATPDDPVCGTWGFLAPEVLEGNHIAFANDWWAVGVIAYIARFGCSPFCSENLTRMRRMVVESEVRIPKSTPAQLTDLIRGLLSKNPNTRIGAPQKNPMEHRYFDGVDWEHLDSAGKGLKEDKEVRSAGAWSDCEL
jgi:serine/threonine protein kinase